MRVMTFVAAASLLTLVLATGLPAASATVGCTLPPPPVGGEVGDLYNAGRAGYAPVCAGALQTVRDTCRFLIGAC